MANGISCAFFAGRNLIYGQKEGNAFKEGIAVVQTARTADMAAKSGLLATKYAKGLDVLASIGRKIVYPLIMLSGAYNTIKSNEKIKTGAEQATGIATMYAFEKAADKGLKIAEEKLMKNPVVKNNKRLRTGIYIAKGMGFVAASLLGYETGSKIATKAVNKIRNIPNQIECIDPFNDNKIDAGDTLFKDMLV